MVNGIFNCWDSTDDTLVVCDFLIGIEGYVEIDLQYVFVLVGCPDTEDC